MVLLRQVLSTSRKGIPILQGHHARLSCLQVGLRVPIIFKHLKIRVRIGAFQSPQLLELSGIGDSNILKKFGIEQVLDLPSVGQNLRKPLVLDEKDSEVTQVSRGPSEHRRNPRSQARHTDLRDPG